MTFTDSPDWQEVVTTVSAAGAMPDAPDWQRTVVGPGAVPIGGYASLTGSGQTSSPGDLTQEGGFTVLPEAGAGFLLSASGGGGFLVTVNGTGGISLEQTTGISQLALTESGITLSTLAPGTVTLGGGAGGGVLVNFPLGFGITPIAQPDVTGSKGGNAALASLMTALNALGLVIDSTT